MFIKYFIDYFLWGVRNEERRNGNEKQGWNLVGNNFWGLSGRRRRGADGASEGMREIFHLKFLQWLFYPLSCFSILSSHHSISYLIKHSNSRLLLPAQTKLQVWTTLIRTNIHIYNHSFILWHFILTQHSNYNWCTWLYLSLSSST